MAKHLSIERSTKVKFVQMRSGLNQSPETARGRVVNFCLT